MALLERLQILIDADAGGAVREFKKIGNTADRELGKATKSIDKMGAKLTSFGAGAVVGAAALGAGLAMFAKEAAAAETQQLKLTNSIKNSSAAFPGNGKALRDQASALMKRMPGYSCSRKLASSRPTAVSELGCGNRRSKKFESGVRSEVTPASRTRQSEWMFS